MSDDLDIRAGGVVAVDTASLRAAADRYGVQHNAIRDAVADLFAQAQRLRQSGSVVGYVSTLGWELTQTAHAVSRCADDARAIQADLDALAGEYEDVEWRAVQGWRVAQGVAGFANTGLLPAPWVVAMGLGANAMQVGVHRLGTGVIEPGEVLTGPRPPVHLRVGQPMCTVPPSDLADGLGRVPDDDARVRIETYTMPDGAHRYAVYIAGTRAFTHWRGDGPDPADMQSDLELYLGEHAAADEVVRRALAAAGVPSGAQLYLFGHSQGGMIAGRIAIDGGYDTRLLVTAGSPTEAAVGEGTLSVQLRHTDDLVQSLTGGGSAGPVGAPGSMVVQRTADPVPWLRDIALEAHWISDYVETARQVDASADPRAGRLHDVLGELAAATAVTAVQYDGTRVAPSGPRPPTPAPSPGPAAAPRPAPVPSPGSASVPSPGSAPVLGPGPSSATPTGLAPSPSPGPAPSPRSEVSHPDASPYRALPRRPSAR
ncbi:hypothetical protein GCM10022240_03380 [Microbacterium kribbense]|uniref:Alpha/beta hydrolase family protein n=1 Tax=Microbacterium kribbense TaxID=433645 RepID=A0ABP7G3U8_9MICO